MELKGAQTKIFGFYLIESLVLILYWFSFYFTLIYEPFAISAINLQSFVITVFFKLYFITKSLLEENGFMIRTSAFLIIYFNFLPIITFILNLTDSKEFSYNVAIFYFFIIILNILEFCYIYFIIRDFQKEFQWLDSKKVNFDPVIYEAYKIRKQLQVIIRFFYFLILTEFSFMVVRINISLIWVDIGTILVLGLMVSVYLENIHSENKFIRLTLTFLVFLLFIEYIVGAAGIPLSLKEIGSIINAFYVYFTAICAMIAIIIYGLIDCRHFGSGLKNIIAYKNDD
ncbi:hypothetical protein M153_5528000867 [Pseudoloma neurophilia]|uniref:Uncharacterized protein n=1 Tax=Pseudoloma neurophilia TaxID=146866 RepID=A0A0R0M154_9MICR|nr:hypothetical protein M153_5528000867 [Pseudoloma neurophilia]